MGKYRKVDPRIWNDEKFMDLSDDGKLAFLFVMTHPHMTQLGAMRASIPGLAAELEWSSPKLSKALSKAFAKGMIKGDAKASFLWLPNFLKYNRPESPNVVKSWQSCFDLLPECSLKALLHQYVKDFLEGFEEGFRKAFGEGWRKTMPNQEHLPLPLQEYKQELPPIVPHGDDSDFETFWKSYPYNSNGRKMGKAPALKAWKKLKPSQELTSRILAAIRKQSDTNHWAGTNGNVFVPHASTWLNKGNWDDEIGETSEDRQRRESMKKPGE